MNTTTLCFIVLIIAFLSTRFDLPHPNDTHIVQASLLFLLLCVWGVLTLKVAELTSSVGGNDKGNERLDEALKKYPDQCASAGVSLSWYDSVSKWLKVVVRYVFISELNSPIHFYNNIQIFFLCDCGFYFDCIFLRTSREYRGVSWIDIVFDLETYSLVLLESRYFHLGCNDRSSCTVLCCYHLFWYFRRVSSKILHTI